MSVIVTGTRTKKLDRPATAVTVGRLLGVADPDLPVTASLETVRFTLDDELVSVERPFRVTGLAWACDRTGGELIPLAELVTGPESTYRMNLDAFHSIGGHVLAASLGGPNASENLVSVSSQFNGQMDAVEREIRRSCRPASGAARPVLTTVDLTYHDDASPWVPKQVVYRFPDAAGVAQVRTVSQTLVRAVATLPGSAAWTADLLKAAAEVSSTNWRVEAYMAMSPGSVPAAGDRRYAMLDYIALMHDGRYGAVAFGNGYQTYKYLEHIREGGGFAEHRPAKWFRAVLQTANAALHGTTLQSDAYANPGANIVLQSGVVVEGHNGLMVGGGANAPEIDHVVPESQGGANCFSNAQLTSKSYNAAKGKRTEVLATPTASQKRQRQDDFAAHMLTHFPDQYKKLKDAGHL